MPKYDKITPEGTRDMLFEECEAQNRITENLRGVFSHGGYREVRTPGFEFYDVFSAKADYYPQESMYKFADARGRLVTVRPDSTIPIARMTATKLRGQSLPIRLFYAQRVYRRQPELRGRSGEIMQMGVELIGASTFESDAEILTMAADALHASSSARYRIEIGHVGFYNLLMGALDAPSEDKELIHRYIASKNYASLGDVLDRCPAGKTTEIIRRLPGLFGSADALREAAVSLEGADERLTDMIRYLEKIFGALKERGLADRVMIDFGLVNQAEYYSSLVFRGYMEGTGAPVLSGGRYDDLFSDFGENLPATGFALNVDLLTAAALRNEDAKPSNAGTDANGAGFSAGERNRAQKLRIALTKGRLEKSFVALLEAAGYDCAGIREKGRKLLIALPGTNIEVFLAKAPDVVTYVEHGVCDVGVVGKDTIIERGGTYYEIMNLGVGKCAFALAAPTGTDFFGGYGTRVIATKYPNTAGRFFESKGMDVEIIKIEGSVELAPLLSLADGIVDIVETGATLRENGLEIIEKIRDISARLIVNVSGMKMKKSEIDAFADKLAAVL
ncbi:MAG: ATP phosphoribosyltransferase regulatory subunit [Clostridiales Family XIII bacterium]|jgi:ATP phosphoribosyltransferase regulatory subunit|nr:ATP phosphoribosyltransferase regulatory subunit [Clostridiales Family XIII bacterium]